MKLSRNIFYKNHKKELEKYLHANKNSLLITSNISESKNLELNVETFLVDVKKEVTIDNFITKSDKYDLIIISDIFEVSNEIYNFISELKRKLNSGGKILLTSTNPKWNFILKIFEKLNLKRASKINSYIHPKKISNIFNSHGFEIIRKYNRQIFPFKILGLGTFLNVALELIFGFCNIGINTYMLYKSTDVTSTKYTKSIIVPAKNEEGNLEELISRVPNFSEYCEIVIICGPSTDNTFLKAKEIQESKTNLNIQVAEQSKNGKANAIWEGIELSNGEIIAILDSDISVDPETLEYFFEIVESGYSEFVNGTRLLYSMEESAMRTLNKLGNRGFQYFISKLISLNLSDTLCGTKVIKRSNLANLYSWQDKMFVSDPFCDFDLIFASAYGGNKIVEYPVHYRNRKYGKTNISRFRDGWKLILYMFNAVLLFKTSY